MPDEQPPADVWQELSELDGKSMALANAGRFVEADELEKQLQACWARIHLSQPVSDDSQVLAQGEALAQAGKWRKAQAFYERVLLRMQRGNSVLLHFAYQKLALLHATIGELNHAALYIAEGIQAPRLKFGEKDPALLSLLPIEIDIAIQQGRHSSAEECCNELLSYYSAAKDRDRRCDLQRSLHLLDRARCRLGLQELPAAKTDLAAAWDLLSPQAARASNITVQTAFAKWWSVTSLVWEQERDFPQATLAGEQSINFMRRADLLSESPLPDHRLSLARYLADFGRFLLRHGQSERAAESFAESDQIRAGFRLPPLTRNGTSPA